MVLSSNVPDLKLSTSIIRVGDARAVEGRQDQSIPPKTCDSVKGFRPAACGLIFLPVALYVDSSHMPASAVLFCLVVAIADGDTLTARCGEPGAYEQVTVRIGGIDAPEKAQPFGQRSRQALAGLCHRDTATIRSTTLDKYGRTVADVQCQG